VVVGELVVREVVVGEVVVGEVVFAVVVVVGAVVVVVVTGAFGAATSVSTITAAAGEVTRAPLGATPVAVA
jgi:hypothetical protein